MKSIHPMALFRLSVLGPLVSRSELAVGELKPIIEELALNHYAIPDSERTRLSPKTIEAWYYRWKKGGVEALTPKRRTDYGRSQLSQPVQDFIVQAKKDNPKRSLDSLIELTHMKGVADKTNLSRSSVYRLLRHQGLSRPIDSACEPKEYRRFEADYPSDLVYGDVMHGPSVVVGQKTQKSYLVSLMDDASRLILHAAFCPGETALDIEAVLKQALLKRGIFKRFVIDNGAAYRAHSLQGICARLTIELIYCRPYAPQGKAKLERWHRTLRQQFLTELPPKINTLDDLNSRLWAWLDQIYHVRPHGGLGNQTPLSVRQKGLSKVTPLGAFALQLDEIFYHRIKRKARKDGTISYLGTLYEVPYAYANKSICLVIDPHREIPLFIESEQGERLGEVTPLDLKANRHRRRHQPSNLTTNSPQPLNDSLTELAYKKQQSQWSVSPKPKDKS